VSVLAFERLGVGFGGRAVLQDISAMLSPGQVTVILGPNGAGKSTLLAVLAGLQWPDAGRARLDDQGIWTLSRAYALNAWPSCLRLRKSPGPWRRAFWWVWGGRPLLARGGIASR